MAKKMNVADYIAVVLLIIGGIAWGLWSLGFELVYAIFKSWAMYVYGLVGIAALYSIYSFGRLVLKK